MSEYRIKNNGFGYKNLIAESPCKVQVKTRFGWTTIKEFEPHERDRAERLLAELSGEPRFYVGMCYKEANITSIKTGNSLGECDVIIPAVFRRGYGAIQQFIPSYVSLGEIKNCIKSAIDLAEYLNSLDL